VLDVEIAESTQYLADVAQSDDLAGMKTETVTLIGTAALTICDVARYAAMGILVSNAGCSGV